MAEWVLADADLQVGLTIDEDTITISRVAVLKFRSGSFRGRGLNFTLEPPQAEANSLQGHLKRFQSAIKKLFLA